MFIKSVDLNAKDIFLGKGWENWVRYSRNNPSDPWKREKGMLPTPETDAQIIRKLTEWDERPKHHVRTRQTA